MWLEAALYTFRIFDVSLFDVKKCENNYRVFWDAIASEEALNKMNEPFVLDERPVKRLMDKDVSNGVCESRIDDGSLIEDSLEDDLLSGM